jgi:dienelactone hydrolase
MNLRVFLMGIALGLAATAQTGKTAPASPREVIVASGPLKLRALLWIPRGATPFPAILFNHGSGHRNGRLDHRHPELLGPLFARHGYVFMYLFRRGDGLSAGQGVPSGDLMDRSLAKRGPRARNSLQLALLEGDEMRDALAGLAFLRSISQVDQRRIGVVGHSFGGSLAILEAERDPGIRAVVAFGAGGYSWNRSPALRARLTCAVARMRAAALFVHASNDYSIRPGQRLAAEMDRLGKPARLMIYPAVGDTREQGHDFIDLRISAWEPDVFAFLDRYVKNAPAPRSTIDSTRRTMGPSTDGRAPLTRPDGGLDSGGALR